MNVVKLEFPMERSEEEYWKDSFYERLAFLKFKF